MTSTGHLRGDGLGGKRAAACGDEPERKNIQIKFTWRGGKATSLQMYRCKHAQHLLLELEFKWGKRSHKSWKDVLPIDIGLYDVRIGSSKHAESLQREPLEGQHH